MTPKKDEYMRGYSDGFRDGLAHARKALAPFAAVAEHDIGQDEGDADLFQVMSEKNARAPRLTVGNLRAALAAVTSTAKPECPYCETTEGLRVKCDGGGYVTPEYTCEACFKGTDDGPCFDDLKPA